MGSVWAHWLPDVLSDAGGDVAVEAGWETRSRGSGGFEDILAVSHHHTASSADLWNQVYQMCHQSSAKPIANLAVGRGGELVVMAAGATNTSGKGRSMPMSRGTVPYNDANRWTLGMEACNNGVGQNWPAAQIDAMLLASNAVNAHIGNQPTDAFTHNWYTLSDPTNPSGSARKIDPAKAQVVEGLWKPRPVNGSGTWNNQDLLDELVRRWGGGGNDMAALDTPVRWFDTRQGTQGKLVAGEPRIHTLPASVGNPSQVLINITCTQGESPGNVKAYTGVEPNTSNVNFQVGDSICNTGLVKVGADRKVIFKANRNVHLVVDIQGT